jgi:shikimate dehydrogenase
MNDLNTFPTLCGSVAGKASKLGVALHNAGYEALSLDFRYVAVGTTDLATAIAGFRSLGFRGFGVSMPHKIAIIPLLDEVTGDVSSIGACNTVVQREGRLIGYNTDWRGAVDSLKEVGVSAPKSAVIVGSGGVARAIAYGLKSIGCNVTIAARNQSAAAQLVHDLGLDGHVQIHEQGSVNAELVVNATPIADGPDVPLTISAHKNASALLDVVFSPKDTKLAADAATAGLAVAKGWRMLLHQALHQFSLYTEATPPQEAMSEVLRKALG